MTRQHEEKSKSYVSKVFWLMGVISFAGLLAIVLHLFLSASGIDVFKLNLPFFQLFEDEENLNPKTEIVIEKPKELIKIIPQVNKPVPSSDQDIIKSILDLNNIKNENIKLQKSNPLFFNTKIIQTANIEFFKTLNSLTNIKLFTINKYESKIFNTEGTTIFKSEIKAIPSRFSISLGVNPMFTYRFLKYADPSLYATRIEGKTIYGFNQTQKQRNTNDKWANQFSFSTELNYQLFKNMTIQVGLGYATYADKVLISEKDNNLRQAYYSNDFFNKPTDYNAPQTQSDLNFYYTNQYSYIQLPISAQFKIKAINDLKSIWADAGIVFSRLKSVNTMIYDFENDGYHLITNKNNQIFTQKPVALKAGLVVEQFISPKVEIQVNPSIQVFTNNIFSNNYYIKQLPFATGLKIGMKFHL